MELSEEPQPKRRKLSDVNCVICDKPLTDGQGKFIKKPTVDGIRTFLNAAKVRNDEVYDRIASYIPDIQNGNIGIAFHHNCRASYTSKRNLECLQTSAPDSSADAGEGPSSRLRRNDTSKFNIRGDCFICGKAYKRHEQLTPISSGTGSSTRQHVLDAAEQRQDHEVRLRMLSYPDLFAFDAKYHRSCYGPYISDRNIKAGRVRNETAQLETIHEKALHKLCKEMEKNVFSPKKSVVLLSVLQSRFVEILGDTGDSDVTGYSPWKLKEKLKQHFGDQIVFISQAGKSDFVCSNRVTLGDALKKVSDLQMEMSENGDFELIENSVYQEDSVTLHKAAGIIRKTIDEITFQASEYKQSGELEMGKCKEFVPGILVDFICWLTSKHDFNNASGASEGREDSSLLRVLGICHSIISVSCSIQTPITFGLGIQMHHDFGSRSLIDVLNSLGFSISYDEVRRFITSVAKDELSQSEVYIPRGISCFDSGDLNSTVHAAIDNFDQNEDTLDGKSSTHCMAVVLYQQLPKQSDLGGIPRTAAKSLDVSEYEEPALQRYLKPHKKPEPPTASSVSLLQVKKGDSYISSQLRDLIWELARKSKGENSSLPAWSGFNSLVTGMSIPVTTIRYLPFIHAPPSDFSTIFTTLLKLVLIAERLGQGHIVVTADLAIYSKAQQILWNKPESLDGKVTMRLGGMHLVMALIASIGKLFGDGGLQDILSSSGLFATASTVQMLQGKHYARALRGLKIVLEAMMHLYLSAAESYARANGLPWVDDEIAGLINDLDASFQERDTAMANAKCQDIEGRLSAVRSTISRFREDGRKQSSTFAFWDSFLEIVSVLLRLTRADREANFSLHLDAVLETVPFFHLAGRVNYARYTPVYVLEMKMLETTQPAAFHHLQNGGFVVRRKDETTFNCVPTDQALEQTINREAKSDGGVIGFTLRKGALLRWLLTRHITGEYAEVFKQLCSSKRSRKEHEELQKTRMGRDVEDVYKVEGYILNHCQDPFDLNEVPERLVNIVSGRVASTAVEQSLSSLPVKGKAVFDEFINDRLVEQKRSFWDAIPRKTALTFADMKKHLTNDKQNKVIINTEVLFRRLLAVSKNRDVDLKMVLSYELAAVPPSLFHDDGAMRKTNKADLAKKIESVCDEILELPQTDQECSAYIVDGMAMIQALNEDHFKTFDNLAEIIVKRLIRLLKNPAIQTGVVILVFDRYDCQVSIKSDERQRRGTSTTDTPTAQTHHIIGNRTVPNFRQFLRGAGNKPELVQFISEYVVTNAQDRVPADKSVVIAGGFQNGEKVVTVSDAGVEDLKTHFSSQEEADTRMVLHAVNLTSDYHRTIIRTDDTDVLVILLFYMNIGMLTDQVYMHAGHAGKFVTRERFIPIHTIASELGNDVCMSLPSAHALTGCDSTNSMFGIGKKTAFTVLTKPTSSVLELDSNNSLDKWSEAARTFTLALYGSKGKKCKTLDELRYVLATTTDKPVTQLPPTEDAFAQHALRARYQSLIWCNSHVPKPELGDPAECGWFREESGLHPVMFKKESAPAEVRDLTHLYCKDGDCKEGARCTCVLAGLKCIELCSCENCPNVNVNELDNVED